MSACLVCSSPTCPGDVEHAGCVGCHQPCPREELDSAGRCIQCVAAALAGDPAVAGAATSLVARRDDMAAATLAADPDVAAAAARLADR